MPKSVSVLMGSQRFKLPEDFLSFPQHTASGLVDMDAPKRCFRQGCTKPKACYGCGGCCFHCKCWRDP